MKFPLTLLLSALLLSGHSAAQLQPNKADLTHLQWHSLSLPHSQTVDVSTQTLVPLAGTSGGVIGYRLPANQGALQISIASEVVQNQSVFVPNVLVLDSQFKPALHYLSSQFRFEQEQGLHPARFIGELNLTPTANQEAIYLLIYTTDQDRQGKTRVTHPAKLLAKAKGNQPPAIADLEVQHSAHGKITLTVENGAATSQFIGLGSDRPKAEPITVKTEKPATKNTRNTVEPSTEAYFNQAVLAALKKHDINKALNLVNEAEQLGLAQPRQIFIHHLSK